MKKSGQEKILNRLNNELFFLVTSLTLLGLIELGFNFYRAHQSPLGSGKFAQLRIRGESYLLALDQIKRADQVKGFCPNSELAELDLLVIQDQSCELKAQGAENFFRLALGKKMLINQARLNELELVPGIGPKRAEEILALREKLGGFKSLEQLKEIRGLKGKILLELENYFTIKEE